MDRLLGWPASFSLTSTDPSAPSELSDWRDFDAALYGNVHFARPIGMIGDRHISYAAPEYGSAEHAGEAYVLDTTDPAAPELLAKWTLPGDPINDGGYRFSPHNFDPHGSMLVYAHYHGGIWVLDLATPEAPIVKGYAMPTVPEGEPAFTATEDAPNVWAAVWDSAGTIWASDIGTGLYHYRLAASRAGAAPYEARWRTGLSRWTQVDPGLRVRPRRDARGLRAAARAGDARDA